MSKIFIAINFLLKDKRRSFFSVLSIAFSFFLIFGLLSLVFSLQEFFDKRLEGFGEDIVMVTGVSLFSGDTSTPVLFDDRDVKFFSSFGEVIAVEYREALVSYDGREYKFFVSCTSPKLFEFFDSFYKFKEGAPKDVVLGYEVWSSIFNISVGDKLYIDGNKYKVGGLLEKIGSVSSTPDDYALIITDEKACGDKYAFLIVRGDVDEIKSKGRAYTERRYGDVTFIDSKYLSQILNNLKASIFFVAFLFSIFALFVGGLSLLNTIAYSVYEKKREIGIMRSIGAGNGWVFSLFLAESFLLIILGVVLGSLFSLALLFKGVSLRFDSFLYSFFMFIFVGVFSTYISLKDFLSKPPYELLV